MGDKLAGRTAVITGASSGIGEATARAFAAEGAAVALLARRGERIEALAAEITAAGGKAVACVADVRDREAVLRAADAVGAALGPVHILLNNAGFMSLSAFDAGQVDEWRRMIDTNLTGALLVTDAFLAQLVAAQGDIVNISSVAGRTTAPDNSVYNATKWALTAWSDALRKELLAAKVRVIVVEPGAVATEMNDRRCFPARAEGGGHRSHDHLRRRPAAPGLGQRDPRQADRRRMSRRPAFRRGRVRSSGGNKETRLAARPRLEPGRRDFAVVEVTDLQLLFKLAKRGAVRTWTMKAFSKHQVPELLNVIGWTPARRRRPDPARAQSRRPVQTGAVQAVTPGRPLTSSEAVLTRTQK